MQRLLRSPLRLPIPEAPPARALEAFRDALVAVAAARCAAVTAHRRRGLATTHTANAIATEAEFRALAPHPLIELCDASGAGRGGVEVLALLAAPSISPAARAAFGDLQSDLHLGVDRELLRLLVSDAVTDRSLGEWIGIGGLFERLGLVEVTRTIAGRELAFATVRLLGLLDGELVSDPRLSQVVQWRECARLDAAGVIGDGDLDALVALFRDVVRSSLPPLAMLVGPSGVGRTRLAQSIGASLSLPWVAVAEAALLPRDAFELADVVLRIERDVRFLRGLLVLRGIDALDAHRQRVLAGVLARVTVPTVATTTNDDAGDIERLVALRHPVARPAADLRRVAWDVELRARGVTFEPPVLDAVAMDFPLTRSSIARAVDIAAVSQGGLARDSLARAARSQVRSHLQRYAKRILPKTRFTDLVLAEDVKEQVDELLQAVRARPELRRAMEGKVIGPNGIAALFNGPPGTGKTMTASAMAFELGLPLYKIDVSSIVDRYVGETEKNLARIFEEAESERGLLLFDEADSLFTKRVEVSDSHDRFANMQVNMLLNLIDEYSGFVILTTNLKASIDTAFLRRMSFKVTFDLPDTPEREALWRLHIPEGVPLARDVNLPALADRYRASGGDIRNAVYRALLMVPPGTPLDGARLSRAMALELESSGNVVRR